MYYKIEITRSDNSAWMPPYFFITREDAVKEARYYDKGFEMDSVDPFSFGKVKIVMYHLQPEGVCASGIEYVNQSIWISPKERVKTYLNKFK